LLVYGDRSRRVDPRSLLASIRNALACVSAVDGVIRNDQLTSALIEAGELAQGLADWEFEDLGEDHATPLQSAALALAVAISALLDSVPSRRPSVFGAEAELRALSGMALPALVTCNEPEGYAHYAVYPEAYATAARAGSWPSPPFVVGLRSIGTSLAAAAASAVRPAGLVTLRPIGHPFHREVRVSLALRGRLASHRGSYLIVDEGPGLSGSSFAAAAELLEDLGVAPGRIVFMPSHPGGPGAEADASIRARWRSATRLVATADDVLAPQGLARLFGDLIGPADRIEDLSAGQWLGDLPAAARPPSWPARERIKLRLTTSAGTFIARFAGLGRFGADKLVRARALHAAGFTPEPLALRRGFLLERWVSGRPLEVSVRRHSTLIDHLGRYIGFRARHFPAKPDQGAGPEALTEMALINAEAMGRAALRAGVAEKLAALDVNPASPRPVYTDGRLHPWEWLRGADGRLIKTDALDHACAHDLIGAQDAAWDIAGAAVEFDLTDNEIQRLRNHVEREAGVAITTPTLEAHLIYYPAFQAGCWDLAARDPTSTIRGAAAGRKALYARALAARVGRLPVG
jgi:hypothetical protein